MLMYENVFLTYITVDVFNMSVIGDETYIGLFADIDGQYILLLAWKLFLHFCNWDKLAI